MQSEEDVRSLLYQTTHWGVPCTQRSLPTDEHILLGIAVTGLLQPDRDLPPHPRGVRGQMLLVGARILGHDPGVLPADESAEHRHPTA
jgi:hypothetical protein